MYEPEVNQRLELLNVRLSYNNVYTAETAKKYPTNPPTFKASFIIPPDSSYFQQINTILRYLRNTHCGGSMCPDNFKDGNLKNYAGWAGNWILQCSSGQNKPPQVRRRNGQISVQSDALFYPGCYVNAVVDLYYNRNYSKICGDLKAIQFREEGEALVGVPVEESFFQNYDGSPVQQSPNWMSQVPSTPAVKNSFF